MQDIFWSGGREYRTPGETWGSFCLCPCFICTYLGKLGERNEYGQIHGQRFGKFGFWAVEIDRSRGWEINEREGGGDHKIKLVYALGSREGLTSKARSAQWHRNEHERIRRVSVSQLYMSWSYRSSCQRDGRLSCPQSMIVWSLECLPARTVRVGHPCGWKSV